MFGKRENKYCLRYNIFKEIQILCYKTRKEEIGVISLSVL